LPANPFIGKILWEDLSGILSMFLLSSSALVRAKLMTLIERVFSFIDRLFYAINNF